MRLFDERRDAGNSGSGLRRAAQVLEVLAAEAVGDIARMGAEYLVTRRDQIGFEEIGIRAAR